MTVQNGQNKPESFLAFELNILKRLEFKSIALPSTGNPLLGRYLKTWNVRVFTNDLLLSDHLNAVSMIQNNDVRLDSGDIDTILEDVYVPQYELKNPSLKDWFGETDAWWFDNVKTNIELLDSPIKRALAANVVFKTGDYALSFDEHTRRLRQPYSSVFKRLAAGLPEPFDNGQENECQNKNTKEFTAENYTDLLFLRIPRPRNVSLRKYYSDSAWKEEWIRGGNAFWKNLDESLKGRIGAHVEAKSQYLHLLEDLFKTASHIPQWAIALTDDSFVPAQDIVETIGKVRRVETIYTKDFSEFTGTKAVVITA